MSERVDAKARIFVGAVAVLAATLTFLVFRSEPSIPPGALAALGLLGLLALAGEAWSFLLPRSATTSIAFIPYTAMVFVVPHWTTVAAVGALRVIEHSYRRRSILKGGFNVAQFVATFAGAILAYRALGGSSFAVGSPEIASVTSANGWAAFGAYASSLVINMLLMSTVITLTSDRPMSEVWRENYLPSLGIDILAAPIIFMFAYVFAVFGPVAAAAVWVPILLFRYAAKTTVDLAQTNRELLELMIKSIEARDSYTSGHSRRVQHYATLIARSLMLSEAEVGKIGTAALLHDVGKIYEKYGPILRKSEKLTSEEWVIMKEHPVDGANLVATMTRLTEFVPAVRHHHENWNGTGYPDGLAGEHIPLASRVIMFADTIDAMTTERPYRGPLTERDVRAEIVRKRGAQFDPTIVDALLSSHVWSQLFAPAHRAARNHGLALLADSGEFRKTGDFS